MSEKPFMITTSDNPFDYWKQFREWYEYDTQMGYNTLSYLARVTNLSDSLSEEEEQYEVQKAIEEILSVHADGFYKKVYSE